MYYEEYDRKPRRRRKRRRRGGCLGRLLGRLIAFALILAIIGCIALYWLPVSLFMVERSGNLALTDGLPAQPMNVLVLGVDVLNHGSQRSDTMMIASIDCGLLKLTSLQRDTVVPIDGYGRTKINAAYAYGGAELAMRTVNQAFDMNVMRYVTVDFTVLVRLVDALGGIEVDITEEERQQINNNVSSSGSVFRPLGYEPKELLDSGASTHLDGLQALGYARIRKIDSDFARTGRQRTVIEAMLKKLRSVAWNPVVWARFVSAGLSGVDTNLSPIELISLAEKALLSGGIEQLRLPLDGTFNDDGSSLKVSNWDKNIAALRAFIYGG